ERARSFPVPALGKPTSAESHPLLSGSWIGSHRSPGGNARSSAPPSPPNPAPVDNAPPGQATPADHSPAFPAPASPLGQPRSPDIPHESPTRPSTPSQTPPASCHTDPS